MNNLAERLANLLGSTPVVLLFIAWLAAHNAMQWVYVNFISDMAILLTLLILRAENVSQRRIDSTIKDDLKKSHEQLRLLREIQEKQLEQDWKL